MAGYNGYSMSNNAIYAYENGEKPLSKWKKADIIQVVKDYILENNIDFDFEKLNKVPAAVLKEKLLIKSSWHHTSKMYNRTEFFSIDTYVINKLNDEIVAKWLEISKSSSVKPESLPEIWECEYLVWSGTRKHPKASAVTAVGEIRGNWFYLKSGEKKSVNANGFRKIRPMHQ